MFEAKPKLTLITGTLDARLLELLVRRGDAELDVLLATMARRASLSAIDGGRERGAIAPPEGDPSQAR